MFGKLIIIIYRMILGEDVDNGTIEGSTIRIYPDLTSNDHPFDVLLSQN